MEHRALLRVSQPCAETPSQGGVYLGITVVGKRMACQSYIATYRYGIDKLEKSIRCVNLKSASRKARRRR